jgi:hypothetical protein
MAMDRTPLKDAEEAWIAKYRSALKDIPVQQSRSTRFHETLNRAHSIIVSHVAGILAGSLDSSRWKGLKSPVQSSTPVPVSQPQTARNRNMAESNAKVA